MMNLALVILLLQTQASALFTVMACFRGRSAGSLTGRVGHPHSALHNATDKGQRFIFNKDMPHFGRD
jgi:hypothetical protein